MLVTTSWAHKHQRSKTLTAQIYGREVMEEPVRHRYYNSALLADSYVRMARLREFRNWLMGPLYYLLKPQMTEWAHMEVQMTAPVVDLALVIEDWRMGELQMLP
jgi:hypothetical protein